MTPRPPEISNKDFRTIGIIFAIAVLAIACILVWASRTNAQAKPAPKEYKLTEIQQLKLQVTQKDAFLLQAQMRQIEQAYQAKVSELMGTANKFKLENGWPPETVFNPDTLAFSAPPAKEEKK